jgi:hypothetical protein
MAKIKTTSGSTRGPQMPINQASPVSAYEPLELKRGGNDLSEIPRPSLNAAQWGLEAIGK